MIELRDLTKTYGNRHAVRGLTFQIPKGQIVGLLGPNGAGKSTAMKMLAGCVAPTNGKALVNGLDVRKDAVTVRQMVGYLSSNNALYKDMTVSDFLKFVTDLRIAPRSAQKKALTDAVERCSLAPVLGKKIDTLSKDLRKRVGLAQAILHEPDFLILDEPTSGLDPNQITEILKLIKELGRERTVLMSTHVLAEAQSTCSRILILNDGKLVADDTPQQLATTDERAVFVVLSPKNDRTFTPEEVQMQLRNLQGVTKVERSESVDGDCIGFTIRYSKEDPRRHLFDKAVDKGWILMEMHSKQGSLEEGFRRLTRE